MMTARQKCDVLSFVNAPYLPLLEIWLRQSLHHIGTQPSIYCTDEAALAHCRKDHRIKAEDATTLDWSDRAIFWKSRFSIMHQKIDHGLDILHSDLDAFWLKSPWALLDGREEDFIFSREFGLPKRLVPIWGFVLCCGFFQAKSTPSARAFFARWHEQVTQHGDDQFALNTLLHELGVAWQAIPFHAWTAHRGTVSIDGQSVSFLVLPYECVSREPPFLSKGEAVAHTFFEKQYFAGFMRLYERLLNQHQRLDAIIIPPEVLSGAPKNMKQRDVATLHMLRTLMRVDDADPALWSQRSMLEARYGNKAEALHAIEQAVKYAQHDGRYLIAAAALYQQQGNRQAARKALIDAGTPSADTQGNSLRLRLQQLKLLYATGLYGLLIRKLLNPAYFGEGIKAIPRALHMRSLLK